MRQFTEQEFEKMISELTDESHPSFDTLCAIAEKTLRSRVRYWCATDSALAGKKLEDDIMQEIFLRLIKTTVTGFLFRKENNGEINNDPDGFKSFMFTVAERIKIDTANAERKRDSRTRGFIDGEEEKIPDESGDGGDEYRRERLAEAFNIVLESDAGVYKVLTWLAQSLFIIELDITKIRSNDAIISAFSEKTLFEMRDTVLEFAKKVDWITVSDEQIKRINKALNAAAGDKRTGDIKYKDFFMKKGGKATISDWVNRMNKMIESRMKK